jgi:hypothetical protein
MKGCLCFNKSKMSQVCWYEKIFRGKEQNLMQ